MLLEFSRFRRPRIVLVAAALLVSAVGGLYFATRTARSTGPGFLGISQGRRRRQGHRRHLRRPIIDVVLRDGTVAQTVAPPEFLARERGRSSPISTAATFAST